MVTGESRREWIIEWVTQAPAGEIRLMSEGAAEYANVHGVRGCGHKGSAYFSRTCGVVICLECDEHEGLARCFCGWSKTRPGRGAEELEEMGEVVD